MTPRYPADLYAVTHTGTPGDLAFYRELCRSADDVLELGCGYGRVLEALAPLPCRLVGVDSDADLLAQARQRLAGYDDVTLIEADMRTVALDRRFDRVLVPHSGIYCLPHEADVLAVFRRAHALLRPGGILALDAYTADGFHEDAKVDDFDDHELLPVAHVHARGKAWRVLERSHWDPAQQRIVVTYVYRSEDGEAYDEGRIDQRYLLRPQVLVLLREAGFVDIAMAGTFHGDPVLEDDEMWVVRAVATGTAGAR